MKKVVWIEFPNDREKYFNEWVKKSNMNLPRGFEIKRIQNIYSRDL